MLQASIAATQKRRNFVGRTALYHDFITGVPCSLQNMQHVLLTKESLDLLQQGRRELLEAEGHSRDEAPCQ